MRRRKVGVMIESFRLGVKDGIRKAAEIGADGFQIFVTGGEMAPENLSRSARREFRRFIAGHGLAVGAVCADYFIGFLDRAKNDELVARTKACMELAVDLGTNVATSHIGTLPEDENDPRWKAAREALSELGSHGDRIGVALAVETGPESPELMLKFFESVDSGSVKVNYDPANLVMGGFDHLGGVKILRDYIVHTHAKDGHRGGGEAPLGQGDVDFPRYIALLDEIGYDGFLTVERETGDDPVGDIVRAVEFLRNQDPRRRR